jgi:hypothetical protein
MVVEGQPSARVDRRQLHLPPFLLEIFSIPSNLFLLLVVICNQNYPLLFPQLCIYQSFSSIRITSEPLVDV